MKRLFYRLPRHLLIANPCGKGRNERVLGVVQPSGELGASLSAEHRLEEEGFVQVVHRGGPRAPRSALTSDGAARAGSSCGPTWASPGVGLENRTPMAAWREGTTGAFGGQAVDMTLVLRTSLDSAAALPAP